MLSLKQTPEPAKVFLQIRRILAILTLTLMLHPKAEQAQKLGSQVSPIQYWTAKNPTSRQRQMQKPTSSMETGSAMARPCPIPNQ
ncbi:hypothetical protein JM18_002175 [Phytophthora kernoviae]|uniref:RxLR effector protein n=1 Tax=Phytophthora kernoviae TaxID=325452 RepID=A0A921VB80_9STRA|nr:hypothetical protein JM18_002175 [Phytophthora kernoviae]